MVRVSAATSHLAVAWRVRDVLARHPLLGGATARITVSASAESVILEGWAMDTELCHLATKLAMQAAGRRAVQRSLHSAQ